MRNTTHPCNPLRQLEGDVALRLCDRCGTQGIHGEARQLACQLKYMVVQRPLVPNHRLNVQVHWYIL